MILKKNNLIFTFILITLIVNSVSSQHSHSNIWADSIFQTLSLDEKIGQLFMIRAFSKEDPAEIKKVSDLIKKEKVGGVCFFQGTPKKQLELTRKYQKLADIPLLVAIDGEWGLGMRHQKSSISYPRQIMLGAVQDNNLIYEMGKHIADQCKTLGINVNFAPVVDVNNNINNPVINDRSFGEDKINVAAKSYAYMQGMQESGLMACAKHFPGHGDTEVDSHYDLPVINHNIQRLEDLELFPFRSLSALGIGSMMVAHLHIPALDDRPNRATTLSQKTISGLLRDNIGFDGLIFTDAMEMKGVTKHFKPGQADAEAVKAGNDIVLLPLDIPKAKKSIKEYIASGEISLDQIDASVMRILRAKAKYNIASLPNKSKDDLADKLITPEFLALRSELVENAITLASNSEDIVPIRNLNQDILAISIGGGKSTKFQGRISSYADVENLNFPKEISADKINQILYKSKKKDLTIVSIHNMDRGSRTNYGLTKSALKLVNNLAAEKNVVLVIFGNPYALKNFNLAKNVIVAYEDTDMAQDIAAQSLFGANPILGKLPVTASPKFHLGKGITTPSLGRLGFSSPERVGMSSDTLTKIAKVVDTIINTSAAPGCQILIARKGKIVYQKSFGHFTYNNLRPVTNTDMYDLASVTKIMASTLSVMKLKDEGKIDIDYPVSTYMALADTSNKKDITLRSMMAHHARLKPWIPFYKSTVETKRYKNVPLPQYYSKSLRDSFSIPVAEKMFLRSDYSDTIWAKILSSDLRDSDNYRYSDLGFYIAGDCVQSQSKQRLDEYTQSHFYNPVGLKRTCFNPLTRVSKDNIVPSEKDNYFRNKTLRGEVHDMGAAMLGGVSGHAGLFSNAYEMAILSQLLLNGGSYGGQNYISPKTIDQFSTRFHKSTRRGIGFDMKELDEDKKPNISELASNKAFGHYGFTGTAVFIDPEYDLIYIFLSNRTYPSMKNNKLNKYNYRSKIQTIAYKALI